MTTPEAQNLAEFLLGDSDLARDVVIAAEAAAMLDKTKYPATRAKRRGVRRTTVHYGTGQQLVQKHLLHFADIVASVHEARFFEVAESRSFYAARSEGASYPSIARCSFRPEIAPISNTLLLRRYIGALLSSGGWPDTEWLAVAVASVLRNYPVNDIRITAITEHILGGNPASGYTSTMRSRIKKHLQDRFSHLTSELADFGPEGMGVEHTVDNQEFGIVREALTAMGPWDIRCCCRELPELSVGQDFKDSFHRWAHQNETAPVLSGKGGWKSWYFRQSGYPDEVGRLVMFRAHALICMSCFERIAVDYEKNEIDRRNFEPIMSRENAMKLRFPDFKLPQMALEESAR